MSLELELQKNTATMIVLIDAVKSLSQHFIVASTDLLRDGTEPIECEAVSFAKVNEVFDNYEAHIIANAAAEKALRIAAEKLLATTTPTIYLPVGGGPVDPVVEYAQVAKAITDTFQVDRERVIATLAKYGAKKGPQLKAEDYAAFVKELLA